ncbi:branched-chain amino acid ABC transporter permease [Mesorhizobium sp. CO1-1-8]|uniref:branched-chain amino acid ABC transporter permease n=1 Tax=Mesorhizobium sp. CO1-1-8 TaxID=2876631 RepID=UPI001CD0B5BC|nr:branched-chain amino acid ABC transporter permease [Mesorhizobium sp. CO1-1-8]MBZ9772475.1 branched-chain amino acid ABC transporter permease [Mesorhizobium sp. CO1-1-8]
MSDYLLQQTFNALSVGGEYALLALGLAIVFSVMGLVNFAHGDMITVGGYAMFLMLLFGIRDPLLVLPFGVIATVAIALLLERVAFKPVRNAPPNTGMLMAFGVGILIQNIALMTLGSRPKAVATAEWLTHSLSVGGVQIPVIQVLETGVTIVAIVALVALLRFTTLGLAMRAAAKDVPIVRMMGIKADRVIMTAFAISGFLAGLAGVFVLARRGAVDPFMGFAPVLKAFVAAVLGGFGSLPGAVVGGFALGIAEVALQLGLPPEIGGFRDAFVFLIVGIVLVFRPQGIMGDRPDFGEKS